MLKKIRSVIYERPKLHMEFVGSGKVEILLIYEGVITVDWGDGNKESITGGAGWTYLKKTYSEDSGFITLSGGLEAVRSFNITRNTSVTLKVDLIELKKLSALSNFHCADNNCIISNSLSDLGITLTYIDIQRSPNVTLVGNVSGLPRGLTRLTLVGLNSTSIITGNSADLPRLLYFLQVESLPNFTLLGTVLNLPRNLIVLKLCYLPNIRLSGSTNDFAVPKVILVLIDLPNFTLSGSTDSLPRVETDFILQDLPNFTLSGNISNLPKPIQFLTLMNIPKLKLLGNFSGLAGIKAVKIANIDPTTVAVYSTAVHSYAKRYLDISITNRFTAAATKIILEDLNRDVTSWQSEKLISLSSLGTGGATITNLTRLGVTIKIK